MRQRLGKQRQRPAASLTRYPAPTLPTIGSPFGSLFTRRLPEYSGGYEVGVADVEHLVPRMRIGRFRRKNTRQAVGIDIETIKFRLFYPCASGVGSEKGVTWFSRPTIDGLLSMGGINNILLRYLAYVMAWPIVAGWTIPAYARAPPLRPPKGKWPVIIFSHGAGSPAGMYSHLCSELASRCCVVVAMEHHDGTSPGACSVNDEGKEVEVPWLDWKELEWPSRQEQPLDDTTLRHDQLKIRLYEMACALDVLHVMNEKGDGVEDWEGVLDLGQDKVIFMGHSFGGSAVISACIDPRFSPAAVIAADPAVQRVEPWTTPISCPLYCINSETFATGSDLAGVDRLLGYVGSKSHVSTVRGATHASFTDLFLVLPRIIARVCGLRIHPRGAIDAMLSATDSFLPQERE